MKIIVPLLTMAMVIIALYLCHSVFLPRVYKLRNYISKYGAAVGKTG
jgi:hypothetical protein